MNDRTPGTNRLPEVVQALLNPLIYPDRTEKVEMMQTQMSFIFLPGQFVYKIKKAVNFGFLDYTTLENRRYYCEQELKLNRRLSPDTYLAVVPITRNGQALTLAGKGEVVEYAVKMRYLPQDRMLNVLLDRNEVSPEMLEQVAEKVADFHASAETGPGISEFGKEAAIRVNTEENFTQTQKYRGITMTPAQYSHIEVFTNSFLAEKSSLLQERVNSGRIRDCHGDLHSQHVCFVDGIRIFDCIEFNDRFRYCDVASEIAFLAMDLDHFGRADLSRAFVDRYISSSNDRGLADLLKFYKCYRAYVRGKVGSFKYDDTYLSPREKQQTLESTRAYFDLAESYCRTRPLLFITVGLVGSGKSTLAEALAKRLGLTVISSDKVRKNLASIPLTERHYNEMDTGIYSVESTRQTYDALIEEGKKILRRKDPVILDASYILGLERRKVKEMAESLKADFYILECRLDEANTRKRLEERSRGISVSDGRWEIYTPQKNKFEPVVETVPQRHLVLDTSGDLNSNVNRVIQTIQFE